jgi:hypothetical protein
MAAPTAASFQGELSHGRPADKPSTTLGFRVFSVEREWSAMPNTSPGAIGDTEATGADQNPVADTSQPREIELDADKARVLLDDPTLDRILGFAGAFRRSELVASDVADLRETEVGLIVTIRRSKTDQEGEGRNVAIVRGSMACPVQAVRTWLNASGCRDRPVISARGQGRQGHGG